MEELDRMMSERGDDLRHLKDKMNRVEDEVFAEFCAMIGVPNIR
jgi:structural maintenance of chromosome 1